MQLLELTAAEVTFVTAASATADSFQRRLSQKLATTLTARLRLPVRIGMHPSTATVDSLMPPRWQPDPALATLWLTRRLGGRRISGTTSFISPTLLHTLDAMLAECWLDEAGQTGQLPAALAWAISTDIAQAMLVVQLPHDTSAMTRWANGVIQHG